MNSRLGSVGGKKQTQLNNKLFTNNKHENKGKKKHKFIK